MELTRYAATFMDAVKIAELAAKDDGAKELRDAAGAGRSVSLRRGSARQFARRVVAGALKRACPADP